MEEGLTNFFAKLPHLSARSFTLASNCPFFTKLPSSKFISIILPDGQDSIIVGYIELVLNFCQRFYNRQFITRKLDNSDMLMKFDRLSVSYTHLDVYKRQVRLHTSPKRTSSLSSANFGADPPN